MSYYKSFLIHISEVSVKRYRAEINKDYITDQTTRLCHETVKNVKRTFNTKHLVSLVQRKRLTCSVRRAVTRRSRLSHHSNQKLTVSEIVFSLTTDRNARHRFF